MFVACNDQGKTINLLSYSDVERKHVQNQTYYCPHCKKEVILKCGLTRVWHFAHQAKSDCIHAGRPESEFHRSGKRDLFQHFSSLHPSTEVERYLPSIQQRPDIYIEDPKDPRALEFQCVTIPENDLFHRTNGYKSIGVDVTWILGSNRFKRKGNTFRLSRMDQLCIRAPFARVKPLIFSPYQLHCYCPKTKLFLIISNLQATHFHTFTGTFHYFPLSTITLTHLFIPSRHINSSSHSTFIKNYLNQKKRIRLRPQRFPSNTEKTIRQLLYERGWGISLLPGWVGLPHGDFMSIEAPPYLWQAWLFGAYLIQSRRFSYQEMYRGLLKQFKTGFFKKRQLICRHATIGEALNTYLEQLCQLGILKSDREGDYRISPKALSRTESVAKRILEDEAVIHYLVEKH